MRIALRSAKQFRHPSETLVQPMMGDHVESVQLMPDLLTLTKPSACCGRK